MGNYFSSQDKDEWKTDARLATQMGTFCVICGGPFDIEGEVYNMDPKDPQFEWLYQLRLVGRVEDVDHHVVASEGYPPNNLSDLPDVFLSEPASFRFTGSGYFHLAGPNGQDDIWVDALSYTPDHGTLFPLHDVCLATSCRAIEHHQSKREKRDRKPALEELVRLLSTCFIELQQPDGSCSTVNDLFNLSSSCNMHGPRSVLGLSRLDHWAGVYDKFYANPIEQVDINAFVQGILESSPRTKNESAFVQIPSRKHQELESLPKELLDAICSYLPAPAVIALHQTSKSLALQIPLDAAFWRNSFGDGSLHPHIWDLDTKYIEQQLLQSNLAPLNPESSWDWRSAAKLLVTKRFPISGCDDRLIDMPNGFWNRCRIWATVEEAIQQRILE